MAERDSTPSPAATVRPRIVGAAPAEIGAEPDIADALFGILETQGLLGSGELKVTVVPEGSTVLIESPNSGG